MVTWRSRYAQGHGRRLADDADERGRGVLSAQHDLLDRLAFALLEHETVAAAQLEALAATPSSSARAGQLAAPPTRTEPSTVMLVAARGGPNAACVALLAASMLAGLLAGAPAAATAGGQRDAVAWTGEPEIVETIAGPDYCVGVGVVDAAWHPVRAIATDASGVMFAEVGPPEAGLVVRVDESGMARLLRRGASDDVPGRLAGDGEGGLMFATEARLDQLQPRGETATIAGGITDGPGGPASGDGGPAHTARFTNPRSLAGDPAGNLYVADERLDEPGTVAIRFVNRSQEAVTFYPGTPGEVTVAPGHIDTIAGATPAGAGGDVAAHAATLHDDPLVLEVAGDRLYLAGTKPGSSPPAAVVHVINLGGEAVRAHGVEVAPGAIESVAGGGQDERIVEGAAATEVRFAQLPGIAADLAGNLYLADEVHHRVRRIDLAGAVSTLAGSGRGRAGTGGYNGNGRRATDARLDRPSDVSVGADGRLYIADQGNGQVRVVDDAGLIHAAPGNGLAPGWLCEEETGEMRPAATSQTLEGSPTRVGSDARATTYFTLRSHTRVYRYDPSGRVLPALGQLGAAPSCSPKDPCPADHAEPVEQIAFARPQALAVRDGEGLYVLDAGRLWLANLGTGALEAHGGTVDPGMVGTVATDVLSEGAGGAALAVDGHGSLFVADGARVARVDDTGRLTTLAEGVDLARRGDEIPREERARVQRATACCVVPVGVAASDEGVLYVSDGHTGRVWAFNIGDEALSAHGQSLAPGEQAVVAGGGREAFGDGGPAVRAELRPGALALDAEGNLYVADQGEHTVRRVDPAGVISTVVGTGSPGFNGDGLKGGLTALRGPGGLAVDHCGNLLIADTLNNRLRRWNRPGPCLQELDEPAGAGGGLARAGLLALVGVALLAGVGGALRRRRRRSTH